MIGAIAVIAAVAAEALAVYTGSELIAAGYSSGQHSVSAFALVAVALVAYGWPRVPVNFNLRPAHGLIATLALAYVMIYGTLRIEFAGDFALWDFSWIGDFLSDSESAAADGSAAALAAVLLTAVWVRSWLRAADEMELETLPRTIGVPFAAVTVLMVAGALTGNAGEVGRGGAAFYAAAVLALVCAQLAQSGTTFGELRAGGITAALLAGIAGGVAACVAVFGLVFGIFGDAVGAAVWFVVRIVLTIFLVPFAWVFALVANALIGEGKLDTERKLPERLALPTNEKTSGDSLLETIVTYGLRALLLLVALGILLGLIALIALLRRKYRRRGAGGPAEGPAAGLDRGGLFRWPFRKGAAGGVAVHGSGVVRLYRQVLDDADRRGAHRNPYETPEEFAPTLASTFHAEVTDEITFAFEEARYGGRDPAPAVVAELERRWRERA